MSLYLCLDCGTVYDSDLFMPKKSGNGTYFCPRRGCEGDIFPIDELMIYPISVLNQKGYITKFCCSGHVDEGGSTTPYIAFDKNYSEYISAPEGWVWDTDSIDDGACCLRYRAKNDNTTALEKLNAITEANKSLYKWVDEIKCYKLSANKQFDFKANLNNRICDCDPSASNTQTYLEFIIEGYKFINTPLEDEYIEYLKTKATSKEIRMIIDELDWLMDK